MSSEEKAIFSTIIIIFFFHPTIPCAKMKFIIFCVYPLTIRSLTFKM